jgi:putative transposase
MLPKNFPPFTTVVFLRIGGGRTIADIEQALLMVVREQEGREASPTAGVIDIQSRTRPLKKQFEVQS